MDEFRLRLGCQRPLSLPKAILELRKRSFSEEEIDRLVYQNPVRFLKQSSKFKLDI